MDQSQLYRSLLRVGAVVTAFVLVFQSGLVDERSAQLFETSSHQLGAMVGMSASVQPTETNMFTAELTRQQNVLAEREQEIAQREIELGLDVGESAADPTITYILAAILFIQLLLIVLNYGLDYLRARERSGGSLPSAT